MTHVCITISYMVESISIYSCMWMICSKSISFVDKLKKDLSSDFEMKDLGETKKVLGKEIQRDWKGDKVSLILKGYLKKVLQKFNINDDTKSVSTPLAPHFKLKTTMSPTTVEKHEYMTHVPYASAVDSLIYAMVCTRLDLSQTVSMVICMILGGVTGRQ